MAKEIPEHVVGLADGMLRACVLTICEEFLGNDERAMCAVRLAAGLITTTAGNLKKNGHPEIELRHLVTQLRHMVGDTGDATAEAMTNELRSLRENSRG